MDGTGAVDKGSTVAPTPNRARLASTLLAGALVWSTGAVGAATVALAEDDIADEVSVDDDLRAPTVPAPRTTIPPTAPRWTEPPPTTEPPRERLVIHGVGDTNLDPGYVTALARIGPEHPWEGLGDLFTSDDLTVVNLECAPSRLGRAVPKQFNFRCDPDMLPAARTGGVEVASLANNHGGDYGTEAWLDGRRELEAAGILPVGVGKDLSEAIRPAIVERNGWTIAVIGLGGVIPSGSWLAGPDSPGMPSGDDIPTMVRAVEEADRIADLVVVTIHWGAELETQPQPQDRRRAEAMIAAGADVVFGHHAHRLQPLEIVDGAAVAWGLGNFVWPRFSAAGSDTAVARVVVEPDGQISACLLDATIVSDGRPELDAGPPPNGCPAR